MSYNDDLEGFNYYQNTFYRKNLSLVFKVLEEDLHDGDDTIKKLYDKACSNVKFVPPERIQDFDDERGMGQKIFKDLYKKKLNEDNHGLEYYD